MAGFSYLWCAILLVTIYRADAHVAPSYDTVDGDPARHVNMFIGTEGSVPGTSFNGGNVFPGVACVDLTDLSNGEQPH